MSPPRETVLPDGYMSVAGGRIAAVVTTLEMRAPPASRRVPELADGLVIGAVPKPDLGRYRSVFREVGEPWLWHSRLRLSDAQLRDIVHDQDVAIWTVSTSGGTAGTPADLGLLELDFRKPRECELAFFGLASFLTGQGVGRNLMAHAIAQAWSRPIERFWVHTCTLDHPSALDFYVRSGFVPIGRQVEVAPDPRLDGTLPVTVAPHVPLIR